MDRRGFIRLGLATTAAGIVAPKAALAGIEHAGLAGSVYYTQDAPGRWSAKVAGHLPALELDKGAGRIKVVTGHEMDGYNHYIVKHVLLDADFQVIDEHMFDPMTEKAPVSEFAIEGYAGPIYALSMCNKHDVWMNMAEA